VIHIKRSPNADTRSAREKVSKTGLLIQSRQHIDDVIKAMVWMARTLEQQSFQHDWTKIENINEFYTDFSATQDGFQGDFKQMHWYKDLHLKERHHLNDSVPDNVNLFDVLERVADVTMAGLARSGNIYPATISPEMLVKAYNNTIELLKSQVVIEGAKE